jgi:alpha-1,2-mannosyltransferase
VIKPGQSAFLGSSLSILVSAPMVAHLIWRPAAVLLGGPITEVAPAVSVSAVVVAALGCGLMRWSVTAARVALVAVSLAGGALIGGAAPVVSLLGVSLVVLLGLPRMLPALSETLSSDPPGSLAMATWCAMALLTVGGSVSLATYFGDPAIEGYGIAFDATLYRHFCASAYFHAAELLQGGIDNVYDLSLVPEEGGALPESAAHMAPFTLDRYGYPPQFIVLPLMLSGVVSDFAAQRAVWTCANALLFGAVLWRMGLWVGPRSGRLLRWAGPLLWLMSGITFQSGNIQLSVLALGILAMMAFDERRDALGGALLAGVTLAKIAPGLLGVLLLVQRRWRGVAWTVGAAVVISVLSLALLGAGVFEAFLDYHLPRIKSGEAYDFLDDNPRIVYENLAPFGLPFKLEALGVALDPWAWGPRVASAYTVGAFALTIIAGRRALDRRGHLAVWGLVLTIAGLRSPMGPGYLMGGVLLGLALAAAEARTARAWATGALLIGLMTPAMPFFSGLPMWVPLASQAAMHGTIIWLLLRSWPVLDAAHPPHPLGGHASRHP